MFLDFQPHDGGESSFAEFIGDHLQQILGLLLVSTDVSVT
jgi:hypothetical protein